MGTALNNPPAPLPRPWQFAGYVGLILLVVVAYKPAFSAKWIWDDDQYVAANTTLRTWDGLQRIWFEPSASPQYYPVTFTSFWIGWKIWGSAPAGYHAVNILLQAINAILLWLILRRLEAPGAWLIAAIWAIHPVNVESVAWISERKNLLSGLFYFWSAIIYLRTAGISPKPPDEPGDANSATAFTHGSYWFALILFIFALLSKSVTATLPAALLLIIWWKRGRIKWRDLYPLIPFFVLAVLMGLATSWIERTHVGAAGTAFNFTLAQRFWIAGHAAWFYVYKIVWPFQLSFMYPQWPLNIWQAIFLGELLVVILVLAVLVYRIGRGPLVAVLFFIGTLIPALGFINVYPMRFSYVADHFQYLACIGIIVLVIAALNRTGRWASGRRGQFLAAVVLIVLLVLTWRRSDVFADRITLWRDTLNKDPQSWMAHTNLGTALLAKAQQEMAQNQQYQAKHDFDDAKTEFNATLRLRPQSIEAYMDLARIQELQGNYAQAEQLLNHAISVDPASPEPYFHLGAVLVEAGKPDAGLVQYRQALKRDPRHVAAWVNLGAVLDRQGKIHQAIDAYQKALAVDPDSVFALTNLGNAYMQLGQNKDAAAAFRKALVIEPALIPAQNGLRAATLK